jgi:hypothetical protein
MENQTGKLKQFFEEVKKLTFWKRIFGWSQFRYLSYEAYEEFKTLASQISQLSQEILGTKNEIASLKKDNFHIEETRKKQEIELIDLKRKTGQLEQENSQLTKENTVFKQTESDRKIKYENDVATLNSIRSGIEENRKREIEERQNEEIARLTRMKETWKQHEKNVKERISSICRENAIDYVDREKIPFKGSPDNTIKICDEFVVFDAKSPASDDLENFPAYIKSQTEAVKKYIKEENVKKEIFLVIPSNTVDVIDQFSFNMADYYVYIVTLDALEPIILGLKKLEEYEFIEQLSPEDRENICRVVGKFAHIAKRRIQIDQFFSRQFFDILSKCEDLPRDIMEKIVEYERSEKLNPPQEKRAKLISGKELESNSKKIKKEAEAKEIAFPESIQQDIKSLPLYTDDTSSPKNVETKKPRK